MIPNILHTIQINNITYKLTPIIEPIFTDWRLPTIQELLSLVDYTKHNPTSKLKDTQPKDYWSSTEKADDKDFSAWAVNFNTGNSDYGGKFVVAYVRCVRNGENGLEWSSSSIERMTWENAIEYSKNLKTTAYYK